MPPRAARKTDGSAASKIKNAPSKGLSPQSKARGNAADFIEKAQGVVEKARGTKRPREDVPETLARVSHEEEERAGDLDKLLDGVTQELDPQFVQQCSINVETLLEGYVANRPETEKRAAALEAKAGLETLLSFEDQIEHWHLLGESRHPSSFNFTNAPAASPESNRKPLSRTQPTAEALEPKTAKGVLQAFDLLAPASANKGKQPPPSTTSTQRSRNTPHPFDVSAKKTSPKPTTVSELSAKLRAEAKTASSKPAKEAGSEGEGSEAKPGGGKKGAARKGKGKAGGTDTFRNYNKTKNGGVKEPEAASSGSWSGPSLLYSANSCLLAESTPLPSQSTSAPARPSPSSPTAPANPLPAALSSLEWNNAPYSLGFVKDSASRFAPLIHQDRFRFKDAIKQTLRSPRQDQQPPSKKTKLSSPEASEAQTPVKKKKNGKRAGKSHRERIASGLTVGQWRYVLVMRNTAFMQAEGTKGFSLQHDGLFASTGWQGLALPDKAKKQVLKAYENKKIGELLINFARAHYIPRCPLFLVDAMRRIFFYRTKQQLWLKLLGPKLYAMAKKLLVAEVCERERRAQDADNSRGKHYATIFGWNKPFSSWPTLTALHQALLKEFEEFASSEEFIRLVIWINSVLVDSFPGVAVRYQNIADEWKKKSNGAIQFPFGCYHNFCWNACFEGQPRVQCQPHTDHKNVVGVCIVVVYEAPEANFDHKTRSWLVIWDAGVIVEAPPWTALIYKAHIKILTLDSEDTPSSEEREKWEKASIAGRGSMVFFNQASMFHLETGEVTLKKAEASKLAHTRDVASDLPLLFPPSCIPDMASDDTTTHGDAQGKP
ncbi:hypothetical protein BDN72DRAFT_903439 [Pluteus cervinus]|uniref:Uncharacterized protein n=1 Tax=Pluteus cervinus TaxID=181527 RepID=A0ACD3A901_9AGAR|nr:hypothetical protein BDN72DRAFT_903439 [Pluteus cervinus]